MILHIVGLLWFRGVPVFACLLFCFACVRFLVVVVLDCLRCLVVLGFVVVVVSLNHYCWFHLHCCLMMVVGSGRMMKRRVF